jgi:hypothetical protein
MSAPVGGNYQDHYLVLGVEPNATSEAIQKAYAALAAKHHPGNGTAPDAEKFKAITQAYEVLADPTTRRMFDDLRPKDKEEVPELRADFFDAVARERYRRLTLLCMLYDRRRDRPVTGCLSVRHVEQMTVFPSEELQLAIWYLKQKGLVVTDDKSNLQISVEGMDFLEQNLPRREEILPFLRATAESPAEATPPPGPAAAPPEAPELLVTEGVSLATRRLAMALKR